VIPHPIRALIDVTPLGWGADPGVGRAGIFRAAEGLMTEALQRPDLDIHLAGIHSYISDLRLSRYDRLVGGRFGHRHLEVWRHPSVPRSESIALLDRRAAAGGDTSVEGRRLLGTLTLTNRLAEPLPIRGGYDVYMSLRSPLVSRERVSARARVLLVHDLIPFLYPDASSEGSDIELRRMLDSLDPERDAILCNSESTRREICASQGAFDPRRVFVVPLAADRAIFRQVVDEDLVRDTRRRYGLDDRPYLLSLSTIEPRKNLPHLIRCFGRLTRDLPRDDDLQLVLVGATGWKAAGVFEALAADAQLARRIVLTGYVPDEDLAALYTGADAFVYPSRYEGFGLPVLEAMQCGTPVVTTTGGSLPEVAGDAALIVDPDDGDALIEAMRAARRSTRLASAGLARAAGFTWARSVDLTGAAWRTMLDDQ
jgi:glycosyltransferase involved in cell wall biosynthesis